MKDTTNSIADKASEVLRLLGDTPNGPIRDADTVLKDLMDGVDFEASGLAKEVISIWQASSDKAGVQKLFYLFTDCEFTDWLDQCIRETTRGQGQPGSVIGI